MATFWSGFETGPARETDLDDVVGLLESADRALGLPDEPSREELTFTWHLPTTNLERDTRILRDAGTVIAYGEAIWKHRTRAARSTFPSESTLTIAVAVSDRGC